MYQLYRQIKMRLSITVVFVCLSLLQIEYAVGLHYTVSTLNDGVSIICNCIFYRHFYQKFLEHLNGRRDTKNLPIDSTNGTFGDYVDNAKKANYPSINERKAKSFVRSTIGLPHTPNIHDYFRVSGLTEECCMEGCSNEETCEGSGRFSGKHVLAEECIQEGCSTEEILEHCR